MPSFGYNLNIPNGPDDPSDDQPLMQTNTNSINSIINVDHYTFGSSGSNDGYHSIIHQPNQGIFPGNIATPITGMTQLYSLQYTPPVSSGGVSGIQLFLTNSATSGAGGGTIQMTGTALLSDGWGWSAGILFQWGFVTFPGGSTPFSGTVSFINRNLTKTINFPNSCFSITTTLKTLSTSDNTNSNTISINNLSSSGFNWLFNSSKGSPATIYPGFYWMAVGF